jgi:hypothetical protein
VTHRRGSAAARAPGSITSAPFQTSQEDTVSDSTAIRPFQVNFPKSDVAELRRRITTTRWPERELVSDSASRRIWSTPASAGPTQGVQLATMQKLIQYWGTEYDWSRCEAHLKSLPHFMTPIDGLDIHFIHVKSKHQGALPVIITHGWPGSIIELLKIIDPFTNPTAHGGTVADAFDVVIPSMPGYGFSGKPTETGWGPERIARAWIVLMTRLGYSRYVAQGGDWGALITEQMALIAPPELIAIHTNMPGTIPPEIVKALAPGVRPSPISARTRSAPTSRSHSSTRTAWATPTRWRFVRKRSTGSSIHRPASRRGFSITTRIVMR